MTEIPAVRFREVLTNRNFLFLWLGQLVSNFGDRLNQMALQALEDPTLKADEKIDMWRTMNAAANQVEDQFYQDRERRWRDNSVGFWANISTMSKSDIVNSDVSPETKKQGLQLKLGEGLGGKEYDDPGAVSGVMEMITGIGDGTAKPEQVAALISRLGKSGRITADTQIKLQKLSIDYANKAFDGAGFTDIRNQGTLEITNGVASENIFDIYKDQKGSKLAALDAEWRRALMDEAINKGAAFDPRQFYRDNIGSFRDRAKAIQNEEGTALTLESIKAKTSKPGGKNDVATAVQMVEDSDLPKETKAEYMKQIRNWKKY